MAATSFDFVLLTVCGWINRRLAIGYLRKENRVLRELLGHKRPPLSDAQRRGLAEKGKALGRMGNQLIKARASRENDNGNTQVYCHQRLGGLLEYYAKMPQIGWDEIWCNTPVVAKQRSKERL